MGGAKITMTELDHYRRYDGDLDGLSRAQDRAAEEASTNWPLIDRLRQALFLVLSDQATEGFKNRTLRDLNEALADELVKAELRDIVEADVRKAADPARCRAT
jgi:hypothetical protein